MTTATSGFVSLAARVREWRCDTKKGGRSLRSAPLRHVLRDGYCLADVEQPASLRPPAPLGPVGDVQLAIDFRQVELDRLLSHPQHPCELRVRVTFRD